NLTHLNARFAPHVDFALHQLRQAPWELSSTLTKHQLKLADRQCRMAELSQRVQDAVVIVVTALWGNRQDEETSQIAGDILCQDLRRKLTGERPSDSYFRDCDRLAEMIIEGRFAAITGAPQAEILRPYANR